MLLPQPEPLTLNLEHLSLLVIVEPVSCRATTVTFSWDHCSGGQAAFTLLWPWLLLELARAEFCKWYGHLPQLSECGQGALLLGLEVTGAHPASSLLGRPFSPWPLGVGKHGA